VEQSDPLNAMVSTVPLTSGSHVLTDYGKAALKLKALFLV
jgi:hypothetical protein